MCEFVRGLDNNVTVEVGRPHDTDEVLPGEHANHLARRDRFGPAPRGKYARSIDSGEH